MDPQASNLGDPESSLPQEEKIVIGDLDSGDLWASSLALYRLSDVGRWVGSTGNSGSDVSGRHEPLTLEALEPVSFALR